MDNDCFLGHVCLDKMCLVGCREQTDCPSTQACIKNQCLDPCSVSACGPNALCQSLDRAAYCACEKGFFPNPTPAVEREMTRCLTTGRCGAN